MNIKSISIVGFVGAVALGVFSGGCESQATVESDMAKAKKFPPPSQETLQKGFAQIAANEKAGADAYHTWLKSHPEQLKSYNDAQKARGLPTLNP